MNTTITIKNIRLGDGIPKLCIPITASDLSGITDSAKMIKKWPFDLIEWRADFFEALYDPHLPRRRSGRNNYRAIS